MVFFSNFISQTSTSMLWAMIALAANPEVQDALHEEVKNFIQPDQHPTPKMLQDMHYLRGFIKESMR